MNREILIPLTNEQIDYMLDLLNNESMSNSTNAAHTDNDAYWSAREAALNDEHIDAECAARSLGF